MFNVAVVERSAGKKTGYFPVNAASWCRKSRTPPKMRKIAGLLLDNVVVYKPPSRMIRKDLPDQGPGDRFVDKKKDGLGRQESLILADSIGHDLSNTACRDVDGSEAAKPHILRDDGIKFLCGFLKYRRVSNGYKEESLDETGCSGKSYA